jgi:hypothetical protein
MYLIIISAICLIYIFYNIYKVKKRSKKIENMITKIEKINAHDVKKNKAENIVLNYNDIAYYIELFFNNINTKVNAHALNNYDFFNDINNYDFFNDMDNYDFFNDMPDININANNILNDNTWNEIDVVNHLVNNPNSQNVHDSTVQNTIVNKYNKIKNSKDDANEQNEFIDELTEFINNKNNSVKDTRGKIIDIAIQIKNRNAHVSNLNTTEYEVLKTNWSNANDIVKEQIINELNDCEEDNKLVCPTGVVTRIINSDIVIKPEESVRTTEILKDEMMNTAAKIRTELENDKDFKEKSEEYQTKTFKETLIAKYKSDYNNIISDSEIKKEYEKWIDHI